MSTVALPTFESLHAAVNSTRVNPRDVVSCGCPELDQRLFRGGVAVGTLLESLGDAGAGMTSLALSAAWSALSGGGALVVVDVQDAFYPPALIPHIKAAFSRHSRAGGNPEESRRALDSRLRGNDGEEVDGVAQANQVDGVTQASQGGQCFSSSPRSGVGVLSCEPMAKDGTGKMPVAPANDTNGVALASEVGQCSTNPQKASPQKRGMPPNSTAGQASQVVRRSTASVRQADAEQRSRFSPYQFITERIVIVRPASHREALWACEQALRSSGVAAVLFWPESLTPLSFRRLQLAAEEGRTLGLLVRPSHAQREPSWADVRWLVAPAPSEGGRRRFVVNILRGQSRTDGPLLLEVDDESALRVVPGLADSAAAGSERRA